MLCISSLNLSSVSWDDLEKHSHRYLYFYFFWHVWKWRMWISSPLFAKEVGGQSKFVRGKGKLMCKALDYDWIYCVFCLPLFWAPFQKRAWWKFPFLNITPIYKKNQWGSKGKKRKEIGASLYKLQLQVGTRCNIAW